MSNTVPSAACRALEVSVEIARLAISPPPLEVLLGQLAETIRAGYGCEYVVVRLYDDGSTPGAWACAGSPPPYLSNTSASLVRDADDPIHAVLLQKRAVVHDSGKPA